MMDYLNPYAGCGAQWYKGNIHAHTTASDGRLSPEEMCEVYRRAGYDFLAITDHNTLTDTSPYSSSDFLTIPAVEIGYSPDHVLHIGSDSLHSGSDLAAILRGLQGEPGSAIVAHPHWSNMAWDRIASVSDYIGIEIYNYSVVVNRGRGYSVELWDMLLESGRRAWGFAVDDSHYREERPNCCGGWIVVAANAFRQVDILDAIERGAFFSSQGPSFRAIVTTDEGLYVRCSAVKAIRFNSQTAGAGWTFYSRVGEHLHEAFVRWDGRRPRLCPNYVRIEIVDDAGRTAWSNPIYLTESLDR
jgi:hypothetical protein